VTRTALILLFAAFNVAHAASADGNLQRSYQMERYEELAERGPGRGETLYFYKCFVCHNHFAKGGPSLGGLFRRSVTEQTVSALIKSGTAAMPGFGDSLDATDVEDLLSYLKSAECCYEADRPPVNPQYLAWSFY